MAGKELTAVPMRRLQRLRVTPREYACGDSVMQGLERRGYVERGLGSKPLRNLWQITEAGRRALTSPDNIGG